MTTKQAEKWLKAFKRGKFKCIVPNEIFEALTMLYDKKQENYSGIFESVERNRKCL